MLHSKRIRVGEKIGFLGQSSLHQRIITVYDQIDWCKSTENKNGRTRLLPCKNIDATAFNHSSALETYLKIVVATIEYNMFLVQFFVLLRLLFQLLSYSYYLTL